MVTYLDDFINGSITHGIKNLLENKHHPPGVIGFAGQETFGYALIAFAILVMSYMKSQNAAITGMVAIVMMAMAVTLLPASFFGVAYALLVFAVASVLFRIIYGGG